eukprot:7172120-Alexandrium_andersonii.AAC.1
MRRSSPGALSGDAHAVQTRHRRRTYHAPASASQTASPGTSIGRGGVTASVGAAPALPVGGAPARAGGGGGGMVRGSPARGDSAAAGEAAGAEGRTHRPPRLLVRGAGCGGKPFLVARG